MLISIIQCINKDKIDMKEHVTFTKCVTYTSILTVFNLPDVAISPATTHYIAVVITRQYTTLKSRDMQTTLSI